MAGVILVLPTPFFAVTGADGSYAIRDLPPGRHEVGVWHEQARDKQATAQAVDVGVSGGEASFVVDAGAAGKRSAVHGARRFE
jgi:hypothetical protein